MKTTTKQSKKQTKTKPSFNLFKGKEFTYEKELLDIKAVNDFNIDFDLLKSIMLKQSPTYYPSLNAKKAEFLLETIYNLTGIQGISVEDNLYFVKGDSDFYPTIVAHYDTAQDYFEGLTVNVGKHWIYGFDEATARQCGIGADDSVGIYFAIEMLRRLSHCKVVLFHSEERGCIGSYNCDMKFFDNSSIVTQLDRRSYSADFIKYTNGVQTFSEDHYDLVKPLMIKYGYSFNNGSCTDVGALRRNGLAVSSHNLSCGYLNEHTDEEVIHIASMQNALCFAQEMLEMLLEKNEPLTFKHLPGKSPGTSYLDSYLDMSSEDYFPQRGLQLEEFKEKEKEEVLANLYGSFYYVYELDLDYLCNNLGYFGRPEDYEKDVINGDLNPKLFVALTGNGYDIKNKKVLKDIPNIGHIRSSLMSSVCPIDNSPILSEDLEYFIEFHAIHLMGNKSIVLPYHFDPEDVIDLPDDTHTTLANLYYEHLY